MTEDSPKNQTTFQGEVKGAQIGNHNIIYNFFYHREEFRNLKGKRVLATIILADISGFNTRTSADEEESLALVEADLSFIAVLCEQYQGRVINSKSYGLLMYFTSAIDAVQFSITVQQRMENYQGSNVSLNSLYHRIGIHVGEVCLSETGVMGHAVNIANCLMRLARPRGICLSQAVYDIVKTQLSINADCQGFQQLKNIRDPILVYHLLGSLDTATLDLIEPSAQNSDHKKQTFKQAEQSPIRLTQKSYQDRQILLSKVSNFWLKGVLDNSLHNKVILELGLEEYPEAVVQPWGLAWEYTQGKRDIVKPGIPAIELFDQLGTGATLLILGDPGSGKTTTLLQMTRDLVMRAEADHSYKFPAVFNLSSWKQQPLAIWLVEELSSKYQIPKQIGKKWIESQELILMLDGLDEVIDRNREQCVGIINHFSQTYRYTEIVVCSRKKDYEALINYLQFQGAIFIQPLTDEQVQNYLMQGGESLLGVRTVLLENEHFKELTRSPLILSLISIAYQGLSVSELQNLVFAENITQPLLQFYIERMLARQGQHQLYSRKQTQKWLKWLALKMLLNSQSLFSLEEIQPALFQKRLQLWTYRLGVGLTVGIVYGLIFGFCYRQIIVLPISSVIALPIISGFDFIEEQFGIMLDFFPNFLHHYLSLSLGPLIAIIIGTLGTLGSALTGNLDTIYPIESLQISWRRLGILILSGLVLGILDWRLSLGEPLGIGLICSLFISLFFAYGWKNVSDSSKTVPNEGIWKSVSIASSLILILDLSVLLEIFVFLQPYAFKPFIHSLGLGFAIGFIFILRSKPVNAGIAVIQHIILRMILWFSGYTPRNYARFLRYVTRCAFMQPVGNSYIFIHRSLLEYFALKD